MVTETNRYAAQYLDHHGPTLPANSRLRNWIPVTIPEMKRFLALFLLMGLVVKPEIAMYWSKSPLVSTPIFSSSMPRDRFCAILTFLHFSNNEDPDEEDKLRKLRPLLDIMEESFMTVYTPNKQISIDEELVAWRGRLQFRQFIPSKRARFGVLEVKIFALCESSGYMCRFVVYVGKDTAYPPAIVQQVGKCGAVVAKLLEPYEDKGYHLYLDNWYTSIELATYLRSKGTMMCGTIKKNRRGLPKRIINLRGIEKGGFVHRSADGLLFAKLEDTKTVCFLSTIHDTTLLNTGRRDRQNRRIVKMKLVNDYNLYMGGVDRNDEMLSFYTAARKKRKNGIKRWLLMCWRRVS